MIERYFERKVPILTYRGALCSEIRPLYFYGAMGRDMICSRIISFGKCNFSCPYCKRGGAFRNNDGSIRGSQNFSLGEIAAKIDEAIKENQVIRLSGGDPVMLQEESLFLGQYVRTRGGRFSIATNGSDPSFCRRISGYLESAAIDLKDIPDRYGERTGCSKEQGKKLFQLSIESQKVLSQNDVLVDVRTPVFDTTTVEDLRLIAKNLSGIWNQNMFWTLRLFVPVVGCNWKSPRPDRVLQMARQLKDENLSFRIGLRVKWEPSGFLIL